MAPPQDRVAVITRSGADIGEGAAARPGCIAQRITAEGCRRVVNDIREPAAHDVTRHLSDEFGVGPRAIAACAETHRTQVAVGEVGHLVGRMGEPGNDVGGEARFP